MGSVTVIINVFICIYFRNQSRWANHITRMMCSSHDHKSSDVSNSSNHSRKYKWPLSWPSPPELTWASLKQAFSNTNLRIKRYLSNPSPLSQGWSWWEPARFIPPCLILCSEAAVYVACCYRMNRRTCRLSVASCAPVSAGQLQALCFRVSVEARRPGCNCCVLFNTASLDIGINDLTLVIFLSE